MADNELKNGYYEGPRENQYEGWTQEEIDDDLKKAFEKNKELKKGLMQTLFTKGIGHTKFKNTEIGEIPEEWDVKKIGDICEVILDE